MNMTTKMNINSKRMGRKGLHTLFSLEKLTIKLFNIGELSIKATAVYEILT
jgi:hypothetical protein